MDRDQAKAEKLANINSAYDNLRGYLSSCVDGVERRNLRDYLSSLYDLAYLALVTDADLKSLPAASPGDASTANSS